MADLVLTSESFTDGDYLANDHVLSEAYGFGCAGGNLSPQLSWSGAPEGVGSFALTCRGASSILAIALAAGFASASHFSRRYREHFGHSPREERGFASSFRSSEP